MLLFILLVNFFIGAPQREVHRPHLERRRPQESLRRTRGRLYYQLEAGLCWAPIWINAVAMTERCSIKELRLY